MESLWEEWVAEEGRRLIKLFRVRQNFACWRLWILKKKQRRHLEVTSSLYLAEPIPSRALRLTKKHFVPRVATHLPNNESQILSTAAEKVLVKSCVLRWYRNAVARKRQKELNLKLACVFHEKKFRVALTRSFQSWRNVSNKRSYFGRSS